MARHSHWANIQHKKAAHDAKRGKVWSMLARYIISAARAKGGDPDSNALLRDLILKARAANMPKEGIERAIKKGTGELEGAIPEQIVYEAYGPHGVALMLDILTDNRARTAGEVRGLLERAGGNLAGTGSVAWNFEVKGTCLIPGKGVDGDALLELALDAGAEDLRSEGGYFEVVCAPEQFEKVRAALAARKIPVESAQVGRVPKNTVNLGLDEGRKVLALVEALEDHGDVEAVVGNFEVPEALLTEAGG